MKSIAAIRKDLHLTQAQLGKILGKCRNTISQWERNEVQLDEDKVVEEMKKGEARPRMPAHRKYYHSSEEPEDFERRIKCGRCAAKFFTDDARREHVRRFHGHKDSFWGRLNETI